MKAPCPSHIAAAAVLALSAGAQAQSQLERVEITGTAIKRIEGETALPVQVIARGDRRRADRPHQRQRQQSDRRWQRRLRRLP
jgi:iron complex outermembrane receptor protein